MNRSQIVIGGLVLAILAGVVMVYWIRVADRSTQLAGNNGTPSGNRTKPSRDEREGGDVDKSGHSVVGGVRRPRTDFTSDQDAAASDAGDESLSKEGSDERWPDADRIGVAQPIKIDANPAVKGVVQSLRENKHPERLSSVIAPKPFDFQAYQANPQAYLDIAVPGRVFQAAQPGPNTPQIRRKGPLFQVAEKGETVLLRVRAKPNYPVSFTSFDSGAFANQLTSITVQADDRGNASVPFSGAPGTIGKVNILAGSPGASGQVKFIVEIKIN